MRRPAAILLLFLLPTLPSPAMAQERFSGPARVIDGDTLEVAGRKLQLVGIDAAELGQRCARGDRLVDCGIAAQAQLSDLTAGATVECQILGLTTAQEAAVEGLTARCSAGGYDLSEGMVYTGWALEAPDRPPRYQTIARDAELSERGLWRYRFIAPWQWRAGERLDIEDTSDD